MSPEAIKALGEALYGVNWKSPMARALVTSHRTVWAWTKGVRPQARYRRKLLELYKANRPTFNGIPLDYWPATSPEQLVYLGEFNLLLNKDGTYRVGSRIEK